MAPANHIPFGNIDFSKPPFLNQIETYKRKSLKIGRNDACNCGSDLKNKKCCNTK